jgi:outer membrane protein insertion porin family
LLVIGAIWSCAVSPLNSVELYDDKRVQCIEVVVESGGEPIDPRPILSKLKTKEGDTFSQIVFDGDLKFLAEQYERVEPSVSLVDGELKIVIKVAPKPLIHAIRFEGVDKVGESKLFSELDIKLGTVFNRQQFNKALGKVKEYYIKKGFFESEISYSLEPVPGSNQVDVVIHVHEGRSGNIQEIVFDGFTKDEKSDLSDQMFLKKYNFFTSWLTGSGSFRDEGLEQDKATILNYLNNKGYADARVDIKVQEDPVTTRLIVTIKAEKGALYRFGKVEIYGNTLLTTEELMRRSLVQPGDLYSPEKLRDSQQAMKDLYGQKGYIDASVQYETLPKENDPVFNVEFAVDEGRQYKIGQIHIIGNTSTQSNVILRESLLVPGETFDSRKLRATQQRLEAVGYFKSVNVYAVRSCDETDLGDNYRDVYIEVEESPTGNISLFAGFSTTDDIFGGLDFTERNFNIAGVGKAFGGRFSAMRGGGEYFHLRGTLGAKQNNILASWLNPYVNDSLWRLGVEISRSYSTLQHNAQVVTYGGSVYTSYPISTYWTYGMRQRLRHSKDILDIKPAYVAPSNATPQQSLTALLAQQSVNDVKRELQQDGLVSAFSVNLGYDSTDNPMKPHRGWRSVAESEVAGVFGNYYFLKFSYLNSIYFPLWSKGTLKLRAELKTIYPYGSTDDNKVPYSERLFLGGEMNVRGYKPFLLGPLIEVYGENGPQKTSTAYGGLSSALLSLEYNQEIFRILDAFVFFDAGSVSLDDFDFLEAWRPTVGGGFRLDIGNRTPIMIGWGYILNKNDRTQTNPKVKLPFFFSMGGQF